MTPIVPSFRVPSWSRLVVPAPAGGVRGARWEAATVEGGAALERMLAQGWEPLSPFGLPMEVPHPVNPHAKVVTVRWLWPVRRLIVPAPWWLRAVLAVGEWWHAHRSQAASAGAAADADASPAGRFDGDGDGDAPIA